MTGTTLPVPDADGIYTFPDDLLTAHRRHQEQLAASRTPKLLTVRSPLDGAEFHIAPRAGKGRPVIVIEPHHDDFTLSASGTFLTDPRDLTVITVFTRSTSVHPAHENTYTTIESVSRLREHEAAQALRPYAAGHILLGHKDADPPYRPYDPAARDAITEELRQLLAEHPGAELLAPAGVTRHPDHLLVHDAATELGCRWFFEDLAYWPTYVLATDDRHLFRQRTAGRFDLELVDITDVLLDKVTLLQLHASQMHPARSRFRPIRHAWTTAAELGPGRFAERFYRTRKDQP